MPGKIHHYPSALVPHLQPLYHTFSSCTVPSALVPCLQPLYYTSTFRLHLPLTEKCVLVQEIWLVAPGCFSCTRVGSGHKILSNLVLEWFKSGMGMRQVYSMFVCYQVVYPVVNRGKILEILKKHLFGNIVKVSLPFPHSHTRTHTHFQKQQ